MKIGILSREEKSYSTQRLKEAGLQRGHKIKVFDTLKFAIHVEKNKPSLHYDNKPLAKLDAIIPRIGASITFFGTAVTRQFEQMGVYSLNSSLTQGKSILQSKYKSYFLLTISSKKKE